MYSGREVGFVGILVAALLDDYVRGNQFGEIVHNEPGKDWLTVMPVTPLLHLIWSSRSGTPSLATTGLQRLSLTG